MPRRAACVGQGRRYPPWPEGSSQPTPPARSSSFRKLCPGDESVGILAARCGIRPLAATAARSPGLGPGRGGLAGRPRAQDDARFAIGMQDDARFAIGMQEQAGIDVISDGEWRRDTYVDVVAEIMTGFEWVKRETFVSHQVVTKPMTPRRPGVIAEEV